MEYIDKWDGKLPAVAGGDSSSMLIDISQIIAQMEETAGNGNTSQPAAQPPCSPFRTVRTHLRTKKLRNKTE